MHKMITYEYMVIELQPFSDYVKVDDIIQKYTNNLNEYGERGWELCGINEHFAFMMRVKKDNEEYFLERDN